MRPELICQNPIKRIAKAFKTRPVPLVEKEGRAQPKEKELSMVAVLVESEKTDSELVIGQNSKTPYTTEETEQTLIQMVKDRAALHQQKPDRRDFSTEEHWLDRRGDRALTQLLNLHDRRICSLVAKHQFRVGSADVDLKQEAIAAFIEAIYRYDPSKGAALFSYAYFWILDRLQQIAGQNNRNAIATGKALAEGEGYDYPDLKDVYQHEELSAAVSLLPERQQRVIWLRQAEVSFAEIAEKIGLAVKTVEGLYYEGIKKLRSFLDGALSCVLTARKQMIAVLAQTTQIEAAAIEPVDESKPTVAATEPTFIEDSIPKVESAKGFKILWGLFKKEPITNSEAMNRLQVNQEINGLKRLRPAVTVSIRDTQPFINLRIIMTTLASSTKNNAQWFSIIPPFWLLGAIATILVNTSGDPILSNFLLAGWVAALITAYGVKRYRKNPILWVKERLKFSLGVIVVAVLAATFICPEFVLAQATTGGSGAGCTGLGFLNPVGTFTVNLFNGIGTTTAGAGGGASVSDTACRFIGFILWAIIIGTIGAIGYFGVQIATNNGQIAVIGFPLVGILFIVLGTLAAFAIFGI
jgi:RNA polymerase sigma factor (sigma-70 family)